VRLTRGVGTRAARPSFNHQEFLTEAVESVFNQDHAPLELVVIDGGSTDGTQTRPADLAGRWPGRLRWQSAPDSGPAAAVNLGVRLARGDVIGWLNADDTYAPGAFKRVARHLRAHPDQVMVHGHARHMAAGGRLLRRYPTAEPFEALAELARDCCICQPSVFFRRQTFLELGGLNEILAASFDFDLWVRLFMAFPNLIGFIPDEQAHSRLHPNTISARQRDAVALEGLKVLRRHLGIAPPHWLLTRIEERLHEHPFDPPHTCLRTTLETRESSAAPWLGDEGL
jgi:glycosyltransferase involved in cell wall biosynthesis